MLGFTGTFRLVRLALRRDRIKLPIWIFALGGLFAVEVPSVKNFYGGSLQDQLAYAANMAPSMAGRIFGGPIDGPDLGSIIVNETYLFTAIAVIFMSTLLIVRHTRQNEETGCAEMIQAGIVGRNASLGAALLVAIGANIALGIISTLALIFAGMSTEGSFALGLSLCALGIVFSGIAAVTAQITESARSANGLAAAALGVFFVLRALGDSMGNLTSDKMGVISAWPSWLSPLGWAQQIHPYTQNNWGILGLLTVFYAATLAVAFYINDRRDLGQGLISMRSGPARAVKSLLSPLGLAVRLQRGVLIGWAIGVAIMGVTIGIITKEFANILSDNKDIENYLSQLGGNGSFEDVYFAAMIAIMGIVISGYAIQALQRLRTEESGGQLEPVLATKVSRPGWMFSHIACAFTGVVILLLILGISTGAADMAVTDAGFKETWRITAASLAQMPAILAIAGVSIFVFGVVPRLAIAISWSVFSGLLVISQFGALLKLPQYVMNLSPFTHLAPMPAQSPAWSPMIIIGIAGLLLVAAGIVAFRRRDLTTA